jgi:hypothetical protein
MVLLSEGEQSLTCNNVFRRLPLHPARRLSFIFAIVGHGSDARLPRTSPGGFLHFENWLYVATRTAHASARCASWVRRVCFGRRLRGWSLAPACGAYASAVSHGELD